MSIGPREEVTERIMKSAFAVQSTLGCGFPEKVYENATKAAQQVPCEFTTRAFAWVIAGRISLFASILCIPAS